MLAIRGKQSHKTFDFIDMCSAYCPLLKGVDIIRIGVKLDVLQDHEIYNVPELWYEPLYEYPDGTLIMERWKNIDWWSGIHNARANRLIKLYADSVMGSNAMCFACHSLKISNTGGKFISKWLHHGQHESGLDRVATLDALTWLKDHNVIMEYQKQQSVYRFNI